MLHGSTISSLYECTKLGYFDFDLLRFLHARGFMMLQIGELVSSVRFDVVACSMRCGEHRIASPLPCCTIDNCRFCVCGRGRVGGIKKVDLSTFGGVATG